MRALFNSVLLIMISLILGFGVMEGILRTFHLTVPLQYMPNPWYGWGHRPNATAWRNQDGKMIHVQINSQGLRDSGYPYQKPEGTYRILVLGDSFAEALQVPVEKSFAKLLEAGLANKVVASGSRVEVINTGTSGYGTDNELLFFRTEGSKYNADLVLLEFCICNDVRNNWFELENIDAGGFRKPYFVPGPDGILLKNYPFEHRTTAFTPLTSWLNRHVRLYPFLREARDRLTAVSGGAASGIPLDYQVYLKEYSKSWTTAWHVTGELLRDLNREVAEHNARLIVTIVPTRFQVSSEDWQQVLESYSDMKTQEWDREKPNRLLSQILDREHIAYVDLLPPLRQHVERFHVPLYLVADGHWNEEGHRLASEILTEELISQSALLKQPPLERHKVVGR